MTRHHAIDEALRQLYSDWFDVTGDANAAAMLAVGQWQGNSPALEVGADNGLLNVNEAAKYLGCKPAGLRKLVTQQKIRYTQNGRGPIRFRREWLDAYIAANQSGPQDIERSPAQRRTIPITSAPSHGFDPALFHADSHKGAA